MIPYSGPVVTRAEAKAAGLKRYFTGKPCRHLHVCERTTNNRGCIECKRLKDASDYARDPQKHINATRSWCMRNGKEQERLFFQQQYKIRRQYYLDYAKTEKRKQQRKNYREQNPDVLRLHWRNRRARKRLAIGKHSVEDIDAIRHLQKDKCAECRKQLRGKGEVDHIKPLSRSGQNNRKNLQLLCRRCNRKKGAKDPLVFAREMGRLL